MGAMGSYTRTVSFENSTPIDFESINLTEDTVNRFHKRIERQEDNKSTAPAEQTPQVPPPHSQNSYFVEALEEIDKKKYEDDLEDIYWQNRMAYWKETLNGTYSIIEREYQLALEENQNKFPKVLVENSRPCCESEIKLLDCYRCNTGEVLKCSKNALAFMKCINKYYLKQADICTDIG